MMHDQRGSFPRPMKAFLREPLVHFFAAGGALFLAYAWIARGETDNAAKTARLVRITAGQVEWLKETWARQWQRPPTADELRGLVADYLKEEVLSREARALELDVDDTIVRRRLAQKMSFLVEDTARLAAPSEEELLRFYEANKERFCNPARVSFRHVFLKRDHEGGADAAARAALAKLSQTDPPADFAAIGDPFLLEHEFLDEEEQAVSNLFGRGFVGKLLALEPGPWRGPIESGYGLHLVQVIGTKYARVRPFYSVREKVLEEWQHEHQKSVNESFFAALLKQYDVVVDESVKPLIGPLTAP
jgi:PPIC-type PPIASE domain